MMGLFLLAIVAALSYSYLRFLREGGLGDIKLSKKKPFSNRRERLKIDTDKTYNKIKKDLNKKINKQKKRK